MGSRRFIMFVVNIVLIIPSIIIGIYEAVKKRDLNFIVLATTMYACLFLWFLGSPLPRYGAAFVLPIIALFLGYVGAGVFKKLNLNINHVFEFIILVIILWFIKPSIGYVVNNDVSIVRMPDYSQYESQEYVLGTEKIYIPVGTDRIGYHVFPSTPYAARLNIIELRGSNLEEGFRIRDEYKEQNITTYGNIDENNIFK